MQIANICLRLINEENKVGYKNHPIVKIIYNNGKPFLPDLYNYICACNKEWLRRGRNRSKEFQNKIDNLGIFILKNKDLFEWKDMPKYYSYQETEWFGDSIFKMYRELLYQKWKNDKICVKASIKIA